MSTLKLGQEVIFKNNPGYTGIIVAFYSKGTYTVAGELAVVAGNINPLAGPHTIIHTSLLQSASDNTEGVPSVW